MSLPTIGPQRTRAARQLAPTRRPHGTFPRKQELAIVALLQQRTLEDAARAAGISAATLWRWLNVDDFRERYRAARVQALDNAITGLQQTAAEAVEALRRNLTCGQPAVEVRAAQVILEQAMKGLDLIELEARIAAIERAVDDQRQSERATWQA